MSASDFTNTIISFSKLKKSNGDGMPDVILERLAEKLILNEDFHKSSWTETLLTLLLKGLSNNQFENREKLIQKIIMKLNTKDFSSWKPHNLSMIVSSLEIIIHSPPLDDSNLTFSGSGCSGRGHTRMEESKLICSKIITYIAGRDDLHLWNENDIIKLITSLSKFESSNTINININNYLVIIITKASKNNELAHAIRNQKEKIKSKVRAMKIF